MRRSPWPWLVGLAAAAALLMVLGGRDFGASSSALARDAGGWLAARRYLEVRGADVHLLDRAAHDERPAGVLVLAFPWQQAVTGDEIRALGEHLRAGGTILLGYSGEPLELREARVLEALSLGAENIRPRPPLSPFRWLAYRRQTWLLEPSFEGGTPLRVAAFRRAPIAPESADVLYRDGGGRPLVFSYPLHRGRVVALPAAVLSNAWLDDAGNADFLESLLAWLGDDWVFDEYHHGLAAAGADSASPTKFAWDLFVAHLALIYVLGVVSLGRRFGPAWRERPAAAGSTASFLRQLGALHHRLGHHGRAAELLVERARALDPELPLAGPGDSGSGRKQLLETARRVSRAQRRTSP